VRAAPPSPLHVLHHEEPGAFGDHEAVAVAREGREARWGSWFQRVDMMRIN